MMSEKQKLDSNDKLATERTKLANVRTFLAFFRSFVVLLSSGFVVIKIEFLENVFVLGIILMVVAFLLLIFGIYYYVKTNRRINSY